MDILFKIIELYRNDTLLMLQLNALTIFIAILSYNFHQERKNPLSRQVLKRMQKNEKKKKKFTFDINLSEGYIGNIYSRIEDNAKKTLQRSDLDFTVKEFMTFLLIGASIGFLVGFIVFPIAGFFKAIVFIGNNTILELILGRILAGATLGFLGAWTPNVMIRLKIKKRKKQMQAQLIDFILSLADGIKTARTPQEALATVAREMPDPIASELKKTVQEIEFAVPYDEALQNLADRINIDEFSLVFSSMQIQGKTGGHLEAMLRNTAKVAEERRETKAEVLKIVRETQNMTYILAAAPFALFIGMFFMMGEEFTTYLYSVFGIIYFSALLVITVVAIFIMKAISDSVKKIL